VTTKAEEYRAKARECEELAEQTRDSFIKEQFLEVAKNGARWPNTKTIGKARRLPAASEGGTLIVSLSTPLRAPPILPYCFRYCLDRHHHHHAGKS
jgi:hypothetical protein